MCSVHRIVFVILKSRGDVETDERQYLDYYWQITESGSSLNAVNHVINERCFGLFEFYFDGWLTVLCLT